MCVCDRSTKASHKCLHDDSVNRRENCLYHSRSRPNLLLPSKYHEMFTADYTRVSCRLLYNTPMKVDCIALLQFQTLYNHTLDKTKKCIVESWLNSYRPSLLATSAHLYWFSVDRLYNSSCLLSHSKSLIGHGLGMCFGLGIQQSSCHHVSITNGLHL